MFNLWILSIRQNIQAGNIEMYNISVSSIQRRSGFCFCVCLGAEICKRNLRAPMTYVYHVYILRKLNGYDFFLTKSIIHQLVETSCSRFIRAEKQSAIMMAPRTNRIIIIFIYTFYTSRRFVINAFAFQFTIDSALSSCTRVRILLTYSQRRAECRQLRFIALV